MPKNPNESQKHHPPRTSDATRQANFLRQTGLRLPHSARYRRAQEAAKRKAARR